MKSTKDLCIWMELMDAVITGFYLTMHSLNEATPDMLDFLVRRVTHNVRILLFICLMSLLIYSHSHFSSQISSGLQFLEEKRLLHRDIKPDNMLMKKNGTIKLSDFSICCNISNPGVQKGYRPYMPPTHEDATIQSDMWALGISLLEIISGRRMFTDERPRRIQERECRIPTISDPMQQLIIDL